MNSNVLISEGCNYCLALWTMYMFAIVRVSRPTADLRIVREVFQQNIISRLLKEFFYHMPYGKQKLEDCPLRKINTTRQHHGFATADKSLPVFAEPFSTSLKIFLSSDTVKLSYPTW